jgi:hypothetical protein
VGRSVLPDRYPFDGLGYVPTAEAARRVVGVPSCSVLGASIWNQQATHLIIVLVSYGAVLVQICPPGPTVDLVRACNENIMLARCQRLWVLVLAGGLGGVCCMARSCIRICHLLRCRPWCFCFPTPKLALQRPCLTPSQAARRPNDRGVVGTSPFGNPRGLQVSGASRDCSRDDSTCEKGPSRS